MGNWKKTPTAEKKGKSISPPEVQEVKPAEIKRQAHNPTYQKQMAFWNFFRQFMERQNLINFVKSYLIIIGLFLLTFVAFAVASHFLI